MRIRLRIRGNKMQTRAAILTAKRIWCKWHEWKSFGHTDRDRIDRSRSSVSDLCRADPVCKTDDPDFADAAAKNAQEISRISMK